jgi:large subunit ribosomal protein L4
MKAEVVSLSGGQKSSLELSDSVFGLPDNDSVIWYAINAELANARQGSASTKDRDEVHGSNTKPFKQKGTGRARQGDKKSPVMVGGGVIFGPRPRSFKIAIPRKEKQVAMKTILSMKARKGQLTIVDKLDFAAGKTNELAKYLEKLGPEQKTVVVLKDENRAMRQAGKNLAWLKFLSSSRLSAHTLLYSQRIVMDTDTAKAIEGFYSGKKGSEA